MQYIQQQLPPKQCFFCTTGRDTADYKDAELLRRFMSSQAKIYPRRKSGLCAFHQRRFATAVKRARYLALVPYTTR
jgi:small subunit ribosomal protein S18